jgi:hypothetical protein
MLMGNIELWQVRLAGVTFANGAALMDIADDSPSTNQRKASLPPREHPCIACARFFDVGNGGAANFTGATQSCPCVMMAARQTRASGHGVQHFHSILNSGPRTNPWLILLIPYTFFLSEVP